nr:hypothetical protein [Aquihabitans sp. G128]
MTVTTTVSCGSVPRAPVDGAHGDDLVTVDQGALGIDRQHPIGIPVERQAEVGPLGEHRPLQVLGVGRATPVVDVPAVGLVVDGGGRGAEGGEDREGQA